MATFAERIEELRRRYGSQDKLAKQIGVSTTTVARWCRGERTDVDINILRRIADTTGVSVDWLVGRDMPSARTTSRQAEIGGINILLFERILLVITGHPTWNRTSTEEKLRMAVRVYALHEGGAITDQALQRFIASIPHHQIWMNSQRKSGSY